MDIEQRLTTAVVTHYNPRENYGDLSPPSAGIVSETVDSATVKIDGLTDANIDLFYFQPPDQSDGSERYFRNLERFSEESSGITLHSRTNEGLRRNMAEVLNHVDTDYIFFIEHDWMFVEPADMYDILSVMDEFSRINCIRFNKYENVVKGWNTVVEPATEPPIPLCRVSSFTNQPHVSRTEKLQEWFTESIPNLADWIKASRRDPYTEQLSPRDMVNMFVNKYVRGEVHVDKLDSFEFFIDTNYKHLIKNRGFRHAHEQYGVYLYGEHASGPYVEHLGR